MAVRRKDESASVDALAIDGPLRVQSWNWDRDSEKWWSILVVEQELQPPLAGWRAELELRMEGSGFVVSPKEAPRVVEVRFRPDDPAAWNDLPTQRALRKIHFGGVLDKLREWLET